MEQYQTITKDRCKDFDWQTTDYLTTFARRAESDDLFFEKGFDRELSLKKNRHIFLHAMKKAIIIRNRKLRPLTIQNLIFKF